MHPQPRLVVHETGKNIVSCATNQGGVVASIKNIFLEKYCIDLKKFKK